MTMVQELPQQLAHVRWIGGPPDAGKSSVTLLLGEWFDLATYRQDGQERDHLARATAVTHPANAALRELIASSGEAVFFQTWVDDTPAALARRARQVWQERIDLICEDLLAIGNDRPIIAEGPGLFPDVVAPLLTRPGQAIWLIPTESFKRASHERRQKSDWRFTTSDPETALAHHIERDLIFADDLRREVVAAGLPWIEIDGLRDAGSIAREVARHFGLT